MDYELRNLENLIRRVDFSSNSPQDHRAIYSYIEQVVLSPKSPIVKHVPTLPVIVYSIQNILRPRLATRRIPELLDLLATVEFYRGRTFDQARDALTWNDYYTVNPPTVLLTDQETASLKHIESEMAALRPIYITILTTCCHLDMYLLWTEDPPSMTNFLIRFNQYFPFLNRSYHNSSPRLFHFNLNDHEMAQLINTAVECCKFTGLTLQSAIECQALGQSMRSIEQPPCEHEELVSLIEYFLVAISSAAQKMKDMFRDRSKGTVIGIPNV